VVRFRKTLVLPKEEGLGHIGAGSSITVRPGGAHSLAVEIRVAPANSKGLALLVATSELEPSAKIDTQLEAARAEEKPRVYDELEESLRSFCEMVDKELFGASVRVFGLLRWRNANPGSFRRFVDEGKEWSRDGEQWFQLPARVVPRGRVSRGLILTSDSEREVLQLASAGFFEPLAHELLREAQAASRDPRTALISGIAALEIGVPSPPVERLLLDYLPTLPARNLINEKVLPPPAAHMATIKKAVAMRNKVVHSGKAEVTWENANEALRVIADVLWLLDFYTGHAWALDHASRGMVEQLRNPPPANTTKRSS
jgi:hypothetical protein